MENLAIAYALIAVVLAGYTVNLRRRFLTVLRERESLESRDR